MTSFARKIAIYKRRVTKTGTNYAWNTGGETALHAAARAGKSDSVKLLLEHGADPTIFNERNQVPFEVAADKDIRNAFRRFMAAAPEQWDYIKAKVPSPLTAEMEEKQNAKATKAKKKQRDRTKLADKQRSAKAKEEADHKAKTDAEEVRDHPRETPPTLSLTHSHTHSLSLFSLPSHSLNHSLHQIGAFACATVSTCAYDVASRKNITCFLPILCHHSPSWICWHTCITPTQAAAAKAFLEHQRREAKITPRDRAAAAAVARFEKSKLAKEGGPVYPLHDDQGVAGVAQMKGDLCSHCGGKLGTPEKTFERFEFVYCSTGCLKEHTPIAMAGRSS